MTINGPNRRSMNRPIREFQITINDSDSQVYTLDFSSQGLRLGGAGLRLRLGEAVKITAKKGDKIYEFTGQVKRYDGMRSIRRIGRSANVYYVTVSGSLYQDFIATLGGASLIPAAVSIG
jgi:hypothetical protein